MHRPQIAYFVHDINDPAVSRRVAMLRAAGSEVVVVGFRRDDRVPTEVAGAAVVDLGRTRDNALKQRAMKVIANLLRPSKMLVASAGADVIIGRNLESVLLARRAQRTHRGARLVYECLDIHRTLLGGSLAARAIQRIEASMLGAIDLLIVSSPAFLRDYFAKRPTLRAPTLLVENKLLLLHSARPARCDPPPGPAWTIGWLGNLRCRQSFAELSALAAKSDGRVRILIAGRPSPAIFDDFEAMVAAAQHCHYMGPYTADDLPNLYAQCHFAWGIDYFEEGLNSRWLLPNKLYEAACFGTVPIALADVETGHWLDRQRAGVLLDDSAPVTGQLTTLFETLDQPGYASLRAAVEDIPDTDLIADRGDCSALLNAIIGA